MFSLILLTLIFIFLKSLHLLYLYQIKEYREDRFASFLKEEGVLKTFYNLHIKHPGKSTRNLFIIGAIMIALMTAFLLALESRVMYYFLTFGFLIAPFVAFLMIRIGVSVTDIPVQQYRQTLIRKAQKKVRDSRSIFIGITGSYGKSSVKEYLYHILSSQYEVAKTDHNMNTDVGIAICLLKNLKKDTRYFIVETGAYTRGEIRKATHYIPFQYAVLTGLGNQHLDLYGSRANLIVEETSPLYTVSSTGKVYLNYNIPVRKEIIKGLKAKNSFYGTTEETDIQATILSSTHTGQKAEIRYKKNTFIIHTKLVGEHTIINLLPAIGIALDIGIPRTTIIKSIATLPAVKGKLSLHTGPKQNSIINDSANSNVEGFIAAIQTLRKFPQKSKIIISQGIIELGVEKSDSYKKILKALSKTTIRLFTTDHLFKDVSEMDNVMTFNDVTSLEQHLSSSIDEETALLIEGKFPPSVIDTLIP
jgi:UDP-N-acetylmuramoyl-tripeptide--D-alanyl-D-alanine ligase